MDALLTAVGCLFVRGDWIGLDELGSGGQGKVYRVARENILGLKQIWADASWKTKIAYARETDPQREIEGFVGTRKLIREIVTAMQAPLGALKVLHDPENARNSETARDRMEREINAMRGVEGPGLLPIVDWSITADEIWHVTPYCPNGALDRGDNCARFKGKVVETLSAIRPVIEGVARMHEAGLVHRDIKPSNILIDPSDEFRLGDFGLVFTSDGERLTQTSENVGTHQWMPLWAQEHRNEDVLPQFDVYSLGKVIWWMVAGKRLLHYYLEDKDHPEYNLLIHFPGDHSIEPLHDLLKKCVTKLPRECLANAGAMLKEVDGVIAALESPLQIAGTLLLGRCFVCRTGSYALEVDGSAGISLPNARTCRLFACNNCGHAQWFLFNRHGTGRPAWPSPAVAE